MLILPFQMHNEIPSFWKRRRGFGVVESMSLIRCPVLLNLRYDAQIFELFDVHLSIDLFWFCSCLYGVESLPCCQS